MRDYQNVYEKGFTTEEIENFIVNSVIKEIDSKEILRQNFIKKYLLHYTMLPSDLIIQHLGTALINNDH
ncbi:hypothetical protein [Paraglaciecola aestuariivivens]